MVVYIGLIVGFAGLDALWVVVNSVDIVFLCFRFYGCVF